MAQSGSKSFECPTCGDCFTTKGGMKRHHYRTHNESIAGDLITCEYCGNETRIGGANARKSENNFCDEECYNKYQRNQYPKLNDKGWLFEEYRIKGRSQENIADEVGCSDGTVCRKLQEHNIDAFSVGGKPEPLLPRFWDNVNKDSNGDCWEWVGNVNGRGYGTIGLAGKDKKSHRISYHLHNNGIPVGKQVNHHCDNKICVNPDHLYAGTQADNVQDMWDRVREVNPEDVRGENNGNSILSEKQAKEIKNRLESRDETLKQIASDYPVSHYAVHDIKQGESWRWLE